jgi:hypothetical protein
VKLNRTQVLGILLLALVALAVLVVRYWKYLG